MKVFMVIFLRFEQATDYKMESRGRSSLAMDLPFSEGQEMKTQLSVWKHIQAQNWGLSARSAQGTGGIHKGASKAGCCKRGAFPQLRCSGAQPRARPQGPRLAAWDSDVTRKEWCWRRVGPIVVSIAVWGGKGAAAVSARLAVLLGWGMAGVNSPSLSQPP